jgi:hypothetical protein
MYNLGTYKIPKITPFFGEVSKFLSSVLTYNVPMSLVEIRSYFLKITPGLQVL